VKRKKSAFTSVELLTVLAIIAFLVGMLIPALNVVRNTAKEAKQKAQLTVIDLALVAFKNDFGDYPPSDSLNDPDYYTGSQMLCEALLGWDLLGFHPKSAWRADGYDPAGNRVYLSTDDTNLKERKGPYLELANANAFRLGEPEGLFANPTPLNPNTYVICDVFGRKSVAVGGNLVKVGTPVLYYRANTLSKTIIPPATVDQRIYNVLDNYALIALRRPTDGKPHPLNEPPDPRPSPWDREPLYENFYRYIRDTKFLAPPAMKQWPYRAESYILISAGVDGFYGTPDDIRNFGK
jgi:type II secretory pathway pseudopilin PulG